MTDGATISIRPVQIVGHKFSDGTCLFETASFAPVGAWGIFVEHAEGTLSGLAYDRASAIAAATKMAEENGWRVVYVAPEGGEKATEGTVLQ